MHSVVCLTKCVLSISHGISVPEHGFSMNELLHEAHGYTLQVDITEARSLMHHSSVMKFPI